MTRQVVIEVPEEAMRLFEKDAERFGRRIYETAVVKWYDEGRISSGKGAELLSMSRAEFLKLLFQHGISPFQYTPDQLKEEANRD
jgi:predicted HTH domain antitoxin